TISTNLLASGTRDIGSTSAYFNNAYFSGIAEATTMRLIRGNPGSVSDFFDWVFPASNSQFLIKDFSGSLSGSLVSSLSATSPIGVSGSTGAVTVSCSTCLTTTSATISTNLLASG